MTKTKKWKLEATDDWNFGKPMYFSTLKEAKSRARGIDERLKLKRYKAGDYGDARIGIFIKRIA